MMQRRRVVTLIIILHKLRLMRDRGIDSVLIDYVRLRWVPYFQLPQVLPKAVPIDTSYSALLFKYNAVLLNLFLFAFRFDISYSRWLLVPIIREIKRLTVFGSDIGDIWPLSLITHWAILVLENRSHSKAIRCPRHEVSDNAFVGFPFVYLSELLLSTDFDSNSIL